MNLKKTVLTVMIVMVIISITIVSASAYGSLILSHGNEGTRAMGSISSSVPEYSMRIQMTITFTDGGTGYLLDEGNYGKTYFKVLSPSLLGRTGNSYCVYYVNGPEVHRSYAPFPFDFT